MKMNKTNFGDVRNSSSAIAGLLFGSANRRICGFAFGFTQISQDETSHIPGKLSEIPAKIRGD